MQLEQEEWGKGETGNLGRDVDQIEALGGMLEGNQTAGFCISRDDLYCSPTLGTTLNFDFVSGSLLASLVKWINSVIPHLNLPPETSKKELRALLSDGSALCIILDKLVPGFVEIVGMSFFAL